MSEERNYESEAREQGWVPPEEFNGDPDKAVDAKTFVERGEKYVGFLKPRVEKLERALSHQEQLNQDMLAQRERERASETKRIEKLESDLKAARQAAVTAGDGQAFQKAEEQLETLKERKQSLQQAPQSNPAQQDGSPPPWFQEWHQENDWFGTDPTATAVAQQYAQQLREMNPTLKDGAFMQKVEEFVKAELPQKFGKKVTSDPADVELGSSRGGDNTSRKSGQKYVNLPADAKKECNRLIAAGFVKDKEQYAQIYFEEVAE